MRVSFFALIWILSCTTPRGTIAQVTRGDAPASEMSDAIGDLATFYLVDGRLRIDQGRWLETAYPASEGDQQQQIIDDASSHRSRQEFIRDVLQNSPGEMINLYAATKLFNRIQLATPISSSVGGVSSSGARMAFATRETLASFHAVNTPYARVTLQQHTPQVIELWFSDDPKTLFQIAYRDNGQSALLTQNNAGRIQVVYNGDGGSFGSVWPSYAAMRGDSSDEAQRITTGLSRLGVSLPAVSLDAGSAIEVPPSNLQDGPLPQLRRSVTDLARIQLVDERLSLDRKGWSTAADRGLAQEQAAEAESPFGGDPFRNAVRRRRRTRTLDPFEKLIDQFAVAMSATGSSGSGIRSTRMNRLGSGQLAADFVSDRETNRIQMRFTELTRHARTLIVDELPGQWFSITYSDPDYTFLLSQDELGSVRWAFCNGLEHGSNVADRYTRVPQRDEGIKLLSRLLEPIGITLPSE